MAGPKGVRNGVISLYPLWLVVKWLVNHFLKATNFELSYYTLNYKKLMGNNALIVVQGCSFVYGYFSSVYYVTDNLHYTTTNFDCTMIIILLLHEH